MAAQTKDDEIAALQERIRNLEDALASVASETARISTPNPASPSGTPYRTAAASLIQNGVPVIPASAVDLDLTRKPLLGRGVYSEVSPHSHALFSFQPPVLSSNGSTPGKKARSRAAILRLCYAL